MEVAGADEGRLVDQDQDTMGLMQIGRADVGRRHKHNLETPSLAQATDGSNGRSYSPSVAFSAGNMRLCLICA